MTEKKFNILNNTVGWSVFAIAATTYLLTLEPTASFWDCGEYIAQSYRMEVGHSPGNPVFAMAARFFANFASSPEYAAVCINAMSGLMSAGTILLLFWTITLLARQLLVRGRQTVPSRRQTALILGGGICGALAYAWSDTFWFSAVEAEVYAFSSFCTALTFWLVLKWGNRAGQPHSDRYFVAIAYVIGLSIGVHLLNLLCVPAIVLYIYYKKAERTRWWITLTVLMLSFAAIVFTLYGIVPGYLRIAQYAELLFVNRLGFGFNTGTAVHTALYIALTCWTLYELYRQRSATAMKLSFLLTLTASGIFFVSDNVYIPLLLTAFTAAVLFFGCRRVPVRVLSNIALCITAVFIGFSSYTIVLLRAGDNVPMNVNSPDNAFALSSYVAREQYGDSPLFYGTVYTVNSSLINRDEKGNKIYKIKKRRFEKKVKETPGEKDRYVEITPIKEYSYAPEMYMFLPRIHNPKSNANYKSWVGGIDEKLITAHVRHGDSIKEVKAKMPGYWDNVKFFAIYQFNQMYWRYLMWNFVGRQNDINGNGEVTQGNWLSGIPAVDDIRLGDQSLLPDEYGKGNAGHNNYYGIPLLLGILGLLWQARCGKQGKRQSWVIFLLFFMTGIAIVVYLNQTPGQARERDYSFMGSFYAFAIWMGFGIIGLARLLYKTLRRFTGIKAEQSEKAATAVALAAGIFVPLQMVSQTWDDHDRTGRCFARDYAMNVLSGTDRNTILFTSGDNNSFPLWYVQDTEGFRTDVRSLNTDYLSSYWYIKQVPYPYFDAPRIEMTANAGTFAYKKRLWATLRTNGKEHPAEFALKDFYSPEAVKSDAVFNYPVIAVGIDKDNLERVNPEYIPLAADKLHINLLHNPHTNQREYLLNDSKTVMLDILATDIGNGWKRPVCFVKGTAQRHYSFLLPYLAQTGMTLEVTPFRQDSYTSVGAGYSDKAYGNFMHNFRWGGYDKATPEKKPYLDEVNRHMVIYTRLAMLDLAERLIEEGLVAKKAAESDTVYPLLPERVRTEEYAADRFAKARDILLLKESKLPEYIAPDNYEFHHRTADMLYTIGEMTGNPADKKKADGIITKAIGRFARHMAYFQTLTYWQPISDGDRLLYSNGGFLRLLCTYAKGNPTAAAEKMRELERQDISIWDAFQRMLDIIAKQKEMPESSGNRLLLNAYEASRTLAAYNPRQYGDLLSVHPEYAKAIAKAEEYHDKFERIKQEKLSTNSF